MAYMDISRQDKMPGTGGGGVVSSVFTRTGAVTATNGDYTVSQVTGAAPLASPALTGTPIVPTAAPGTNTTQAASTAFVTAAVSASVSGVSSFNTRTGAVVPASGDYTAAQVTGAAPLASPALTGTPTVPTAAVDTNTTQAASVAFVLAQAAAATPLIDGSATVGTSTRYARADHVHPTDTTRAALASPTFTGTPAVPTAATGTNTTQAASTAFVQAAIAPTLPTTSSVAYASTITWAWPANGQKLLLNINTALTGGLEFLNPTGTPTPGQQVEVYGVQDGTGGRTITADTNFSTSALGVTLGNVTTDPSAPFRLLFEWNSFASKIELRAVN